MLREVVTLIFLLSALAISPKAKAVTFTSYLRNLYNGAAYVVGGGLRCEKVETTLSDLHSVDCLTRSQFVGGNTQDTTPFLKYSEWLVLNDLATDAEASVDCNLPLLDGYVASGAKPKGRAARMNHLAYSQFLAKRGDLQAAGNAIYTRRQKLEDDIVGHCGLPPSSICAHEWSVAAYQDIDKIHTYMASMTATVLMGNTGNIRDMIENFAMDSTPPTEAEFSLAYSKKVAALDRDLHAFKKTISGAHKKLDGGASFYNFDEIPSIREQLMMSPQYDSTLAQLGASSSVRQKMTCARNAEFKTGPSRIQAAVLGMTVLSMAVGAGEVAVAGEAVSGQLLTNGTKAVMATVSESGSVSTAVVSESALAQNQAAQAMRVGLHWGIAGSDVVLSGAQVASKCFDTPTPVGVSKAGERKCTEEQAFDGQVEKATRAECGVAYAQAAISTLVPLAKLNKMMKSEQIAKDNVRSQIYRAQDEAELQKEAVVEGSKTKIQLPPQNIDSAGVPLPPRKLSPDLTATERQAALVPYQQTFRQTARQLQEFKALLKSNASVAQREPLVKIRNDLLDRDAWSRYMESLARDTAKAAGGKRLFRKQTLRVLSERAAARGETKLVTLTTNETDPEVMREAIENGFYDQYGGQLKQTLATRDGNVIQGRTHGEDTHLIQRDFIAQSAAKNWPGGYKAFYKFLGTPKGQELFGEIFDKPFADNGTDPSWILRMFNGSGIPIE